MSATFWNMRRRLRKQLGIEREIKEAAGSMAEVEAVEKNAASKAAKKQVKK